MTSKERFIKTLLFEETDKVPFIPGGPRESTLKRWRQEGLPENVNWREYFFEKTGIRNEPEVKEGFPFTFNLEMMPEFEEKVLAHVNGHFIVQDCKGAVVEIADNFDVTYLRKAKDFVTRKWHKFPVENEKDWEDIKRRYDAQDPSRISPPHELEKAGYHFKNAQYPLNTVLLGPFWKMRDWCGLENLCIFMATMPDFVEEMAFFWRDFILSMLNKIKGRVSFDMVTIGEDMAYKEKSMISPAMVRKFLMPVWKSWVETLGDSGCKIINMDSDGYIGELIPLWIESGINCCSPVEVAAGNDIVAYRKLYGNKMAFKGGIDKRAIAKGGKVMESEVYRVVPPLLKDGGYIPGCDHSVPSDVSWGNFFEYCRLLAKLQGWL